MVTATDYSDLDFLVFTQSGPKSDLYSLGRKSISAGVTVVCQAGVGEHCEMWKTLQPPHL